MPELLSVEGLVAGYGESVVLDGVSFSLEEGGTLSLLGRNGVGKTTLLLSLMGLTHLQRGRLIFSGSDLTALPTHRRAPAGIGWVPQERCVFPSLTVEEHLQVIARPGEWTLPRVFQLFPRLEARRHHRGNQLSGGEQQMLAIGRALMVNPRLLLLDEPMEGLAPVIVQELAALVRQIAGQGSMAVILVEQRARLALGLTRDALVIERGRVVHRCSSKELIADPAALGQLVGVA
jgi:branched-chain amino acid transport system ATP-binding protein